MLGGLEDVLDGDQAAKMERVVDDQNPLKAVHAQQFLGILDAGALLDRDQTLARGHDRPD